jgi:flagellar M-ring protein FliF
LAVPRSIPKSFFKCFVINRKGIPITSFDKNEYPQYTPIRTVLIQEIDFAPIFFIDFKQKTSEETSYSPVIGDNGIISHHDYENSSANEGTVPGGIPGTETNTGLPTYQEGDAYVNSNSNANASGSTDYLVNQMIETIIDNGGTIKDLTVAVAINSKELSEDKITQYRELIAYGAGISTEKVVITYAEFQAEDPPPTVVPNDSNNKSLPEMFGIKAPVLYVTFGGAALLLISFLLIAAGRHRQKKRKEKEKNLSAEAEIQAAKQRLEVPRVVINDTREQVLKKQIKDFSTESPEIVAQLLRSWMKEDNSK